MSVTEATLTGMADWYKDDMFVQADKTGTMPDNDVVDLVTNIINKYTTSKTERRSHYQITKVTFLVDSCKNINKDIPVKPISSKVIIKFGKNAEQKVVNEKSLNLLKEIGELTKNYSITIISTARDPYNQARVMYENIILNGMKEQRKTYAASGQKVLDSYEFAKSKGKAKEGIIKEMEAKIKELGSTTVSKHCVDPSIMNVFDVSIAGLSNPKDFKREITKKVTKVLVENNCYHIEIKQ
ncbi:hypothetical protein [Empedobacter tilapiae]|uniref:Uncharacterized protein n=1 Tax=Empedobacter tilapiae TaxID=2491114 RepID=A0A4Z1AZG6_9FLAO|nr:hypothetical protein [Empedobacter tilapiae]TGN22996.1 hypothetical protein E4J94_15795 [Empedobacter tilapiae]